MVKRLTKKVVDGLKKPPAGKRTKVYDALETGFGVVRYPSGKISFFLEYGGRGKQRRITLGPYPALTVEKAREKAIALRGTIVQGKDPLAERRYQQNMPTFAEWVEEYLAGVLQKKKRPEVFVWHLKGTKGGHKKNAKPVAAEAMKRWARRPLDSITMTEIEAWLKFIADTRGRIAANRHYTVLRTCLEHAVEAGLLRHNPARYVKKYPENPARNRVLSDEELGKVLRAVKALSDPFDRGFFLLLIETGCRKSEALTAKWEDFDLNGGTWTIPSPKAGRPQTLPLVDSTVALLRKIPRKGEWLFPGRKRGTHRTHVRGPWAQICEAAGLKDVTIHDIRRTYGLAVAKKSGILAASRLLRHHNIQITAKVYAPLGVEDLRQVAEDVLAERGKVLKMRRRTPA